ncbi:4Fe-4S binding protein [Maridesulfovibrio frigidus]|uniref:4Fe-4S binding protein n=1 Tax=Maridesulfovibrio frigidus TaxID=340956 RepID=UPI0004E16040|nr:4Fe-4S binding protein [Maridesulfovibrio frigidus]
MADSKLKLIYFSPTRTTRRVLDAVAKGFGAGELTVFDVTREEGVPQDFDCANDDLVIIGTPVYAGRVPAIALERLASLKGAGVPAVLVVVYGNRAFDDALLELKDFSAEAGFKPVAAAAFIGEHSYSTKVTPVAVGRPDAGDIVKAEEFGRELAVMFQRGKWDNGVGLNVPGANPYKERVNRALVAPFSQGNCELCGACERVCPTGAITVGVEVVTDADNCILCCACVKVCTNDSRKMEVPRVLEISKWLSTNCAERREPDVFLAQ